MDVVDLTILRHLRRDGRAAWADLAVELRLSAPAIAQRVRRLQDRGIIRQFVAWVAPQTLVPVSAPDWHADLPMPIAEALMTPRL